MVKITATIVSTTRVITSTSFSTEAPLPISSRLRSTCVAILFDRLTPRPAARPSKVAAVMIPKPPI